MTTPGPDDIPDSTTESETYHVIETPDQHSFQFLDETISFVFRPTDIRPNHDGPFLWEHPSVVPADMCAPDGWYIWTERGLKYLGKSPAMGDETP